MESTLRNLWSHRGAGAVLLLPLALVYRVVTGVRRWLYRVGILRTQRVGAAVVVVGNVITGGAGKTPTVLALVAHLQARGIPVGVISRGYGRSSARTLEVTPQASARAVGDEPLLIRRRSGAPVFVGNTRMEAARALLAQYPQTRVIVCDDGLQHYALYRDLDICVFDDRGLGNGWLLPAGPLRERWPCAAVQRAGQASGALLVLHTGQKPAFAGFVAQRSLSDHALASDGRSMALAALGQPGARPLLALAGLAQPEAFFAMLRARGLTLARTLALPDHYDFDSFRPSIYAGYQLICTEKDAFKLWPLVPDAWAVPLQQAMEPAFWEQVDARLVQALAAKL